MPGYATREITVRVAAHDYRIHALSDKQQFADPQQIAERLGISSAQWCLFGQLWPAGTVLAQTLSRHDIAGKRILELGCGLALSSLVLKRRGADVTASDYHPLAETFLLRNAAQNGLDPIPFRRLDWAVPDTTLGRFDLIVGSDILYERGHAELLADVLERHAAPRCEVMMTDPGRGHANRLTRALAPNGYTVDELRSRFHADDVAPFRGRLLTWRRGEMHVALGDAA